MAGKGIVINFISDIRRFLKGTDDVGEALEQVSDSLDEVAREGDQATEKLERSFKDLTKVIDTESDDAARKMARNIDRGTDQAKRDLDELKNESRQNFAETFSSFDGSIESLVNGIQGTLGGVTAGLGSIGAFAAAAAGAAGLGLIVASLQRQQEEADKLKARLTSAYQEAAAEGRDYLTTAQLVSAAQDIFFNPERRDELNRFKSEAQKIGVDINTYVLAQAGDYDALTFAIQQAKDAEAERRDELLREGASAGSVDQLLGAEGYPRLIEQLQSMGQQHLTNRENAALYSDFVRTLTVEESTRIARVRDAEQDRWDALADRYTEAAGRAPVTIATELEQPDVESIRRNTQGSFERNPLKVRARLVTREGKELT